MNGEADLVTVMVVSGWKACVLRSVDYVSSCPIQPLARWARWEHLFFARHAHALRFYSVSCILRVEWLFREPAEVVVSGGTHYVV